MNEEPRSLVPAAVVLGGSVVVSTVLVLLFAWFVGDRWVGRIDAAMRDATRTAQQSAAEMRGTVDEKFAETNRTLSRLYVEVNTPQPIKLRGVKDDGAIPVDARVGKE